MPSANLLEQRTEAWAEARKGKITASLAAAILGLDPYKGPLAAFNEITGRTSHKGNQAMRWGVEFEQRAREDYEIETGNLVSNTGFWLHHDHDWLGASPDGLVGADGLVEIKCPKELPESPPGHHCVQMKVQMACTNREWVDYFVWTPEGHFLHRVTRDPSGEAAMIALLDQWRQKYLVPDEAPPRRRVKA